jgi:hypothetical protein
MREGSCRLPLNKHRFDPYNLFYTYIPRGFYTYIPRVYGSVPLTLSGHRRHLSPVGGCSLLQARTKTIFAVGTLKVYNATCSICEG